MSPNRWTVYPVHRPAASVRLVCIPHAGAGVAAFHTWAKDIDSDIEVGIVRLPGRESRIREPPIRDMREAVVRLCDAIHTEVRPPFAILGHCSGALIALAVTQHLHSIKSRLPIVLLVSSQQPPHLTAHRTHTSQLPDDEFIAVLKEIGATDPELLADSEMARLLLPVIRADTSLIESFTADPTMRLPVPIHVLAGAEDSGLDRNIHGGWERYTLAGFARSTFTGGHFFLFDRSSLVLPTVADILRDRLSRT